MNFRNVNNLWCIYYLAAKMRQGENVIIFYASNTDSDQYFCFDANKSIEYSTYGAMTICIVIKWWLILRKNSYIWKWQACNKTITCQNGRGNTS